MTSFGLPDEPLLHLLAEIMERHHRPLHDAGVRVGVILAQTDGDGPPVSHGGYPALATIRIVSLKDRLSKSFDAELLIDRQEFEDLTERQRAALIDHELSHLQLAKFSYSSKTDAYGEPIEGAEEIRFVTDDLNRPKLKLKKGDFHLGDGFAGVIRRNGADAVEFIHIRKIHRYAESVYDEALQEELKNARANLDRHKKETPSIFNEGMNQEEFEREVA
jgi:hypothetical protein